MDKMKWIKKFENTDQESIKFQEYFQDLCDNWEIKIEYDSKSESNKWTNILIIDIQLGRNLWMNGFPNIGKYRSDVKVTFENTNQLEIYLKFMSELKSCIDQMISQSEGSYKFLNISQSDHSYIKISIEI